MSKFLTKIAGIGVVLASLTAVPAIAQDMSDFDGDGDGVISEDEFGSTWSDMGVYDSWDADGDGYLSEDEFDTGVFDSYDADGSGVIEEPEYGDLNDDMGDGGFWDV